MAIPFRSPSGTRRFSVDRVSSNNTARPAEPRYTYNRTCGIEKINVVAAKGIKPIRVRPNR
jgi:hypothetical protein